MRQWIFILAGGTLRLTLYSATGISKYHNQIKINQIQSIQNIPTTYHTETSSDPVHISYVHPGE